VAIVGDFSTYDSKYLTRFFEQSNKGNQVSFVGDKETVIKMFKRPLKHLGYIPLEMKINTCRYRIHNHRNKSVSK